MKKILLTGMMILALGACTSTQTEDTTRLSRDTENWIDYAGDIDSEYWWINNYSDNSDD